MDHYSAVVRFLCARLVKFARAFLFLVCAAVLVPASRADSLHYFKNYFVTGDYTVAGVGLFGTGVHGTAIGTINMTTVPAGADIVAAFLYWQTVETSSAPSTINGVFDGNPIVGEALGNPSTASCWSQGGTSPQTSARVYRADVLRYFTNIDPANHVRLVNGKHTVQLPDSGSTIMSVLPHTEGATLVIVYRMLALGAASYKSVVIFDGANTMSKFGPAFSTPLGGFYDAAGPDAHGNLTAKMTHIVGNGQPNFAVGLTVNGKTPAGVASTVLDGSAGTRWDNPTFAISLAQGASSVTTQVSPGNNQVCLTWGAILMSTDVENTDGDGNLNSWKLNGLHFDPGKATYPNPVPATFGDCTTNPKNCENFKAMGAVLGAPLKPHPDVFVQIDWLERTDGPPALNHIHAPKLAALQMIYNVFKSQGIYMHFDVGNRYQFNPPLPFIIPGPPYAKGGNVVQESTLFCPNAIITDYTKCEYVTNPSAPGGLGYLVSGWKIGLDAFKNGFPILNINNPLLPPDRKDTFRYAVFGHALGGPSDPITGKPLSATPPSSSGVADLLGGDILVTLGLWPGDNHTPTGAPCTPDDLSGTVPDGNLCVDQTGTSLQQAGTLMHELGHTVGLRHGGAAALPNCMPIYPSVMNYLYQTHGLTDRFGNKNIDYSLGTLAPINENGLYENTPLGLLAPPKYSIRYYAPASKAELVAGSEARAHCDGSSTMGANEVREEAPWGQTPDWDNDGDQNTPDGTAVSVDVNFNGSFTDVMNDYNDWANLNLRQVGARPNVGGLSVEVGPLDLGSTDLGQTELGQTELGQTELGQTELGQTELGQTELGQTELGQTELGEVDYSAAISSLDPTGPINAPVNDPNGLLEASLATDATLASTGHPGNNEVVLNWGGPTLGQIRTFNIWRTNVTPGAPQNQTVQVGSVSAVAAMPPTTFADKVNDFSMADSGANCPAASTCYNASYQYFITAEDSNLTISSASNFVTATVDHIFVTPVSGTFVYGNALPDLTSANPNIVSGLPMGALAPAAFTCTWTGPSNSPTPPRNFGGYTTSCSVPATVNSGTVGVTYTGNGTVTIIPRPLYIDATTNSKVYDSTVSPVPATVVPSIEATVAGVGALSGSGLVNGDTVAGLAEVYQSPNVTDAGSKTLVVCAPPTPAVCPSSYTVNDLDGGNNYTVTTKTAAGTINPRPLMVTATGVSKVYDGTTTATVILSDNRLPDAYDAPFTDSYGSASFVTANAGNNIAVNVSGISISGQGASNYTANTIAATTANITPRPATWTTNPNSKTYGDSDPSPLTTGSGTNFVAADGVTAAYSRTPGETVLGGPYLITATLSPAAALSNYSITNAGANFTINTRAATWTTNPNSKTYGNADPNPLTTGSGMNFVAADGVTATYSRVPGEGVSAYAIAATLNPAGVLSNYNVTNSGNTFTITTAILTVLASPQAKAYGQTDPVLTYNASGFQFNDTAASVLTGALTRAVGENVNTSPGYAISEGTLVANANYVISFTGNYLTITPAPLAAVVTGLESGGTPPSTFTVGTVTYSGFVSPDTSAVVNGTVSCTVSAVDAAGDYPISCSGATAANYAINYSYSVGPSNRRTVLATDAGGNVLMFGGSDGVNNLADTWLWNGTKWTQQSPLASPPARNLNGMVFDPDLNETVLFGGVGATGYIDTWTWDGSNWNNITPGTSPPQRYAFAMDYDAAAPGIVIFGGFTSNGPAINDTWLGSVNNNALTYTSVQSTTSPSVRCCAAMAFDPNSGPSGSTLLFGGVGPDNNYVQVNDTWRLQGGQWTQLSPGNSPPARSGAAMVYDPITKTIVLFGGTSSSGDLNDTWTWDGTTSTWTQASPLTSPPPRRFDAQGMAYGPNGTVVMFGGFAHDTASNTDIPLGDTWSWNGTNWVEQTAPLTVTVNGTQPVGGTPTYTATYSGFVNGDTLSVVTGTLSCTTTTPITGPGSYSIASCSGLTAPKTYTIVYVGGTLTVQ